MKEPTKQDGVKAREELCGLLTALQCLSASREYSAWQHASGRQALKRQHIFALLSAGNTPTDKQVRKLRWTHMVLETETWYGCHTLAPLTSPRSCSQTPWLPEHREHFGHFPNRTDLVFDNLLTCRSCIGWKETNRYSCSGCGQKPIKFTVCWVFKRHKTL